MSVQRARNGDVDLACETSGSAGGEPLLLIREQAARAVSWTTAPAARGAVTRN